MPDQYQPRPPNISDLQWNQLQAMFPATYGPPYSGDNTDTGLGGYFDGNNNATATGARQKLTYNGQLLSFDPATGIYYDAFNNPIDPNSLSGGGAGGGGGGSAATPYMSYDPFTQQLQAAQLQESIRQANLSAGLNRAQYLQQTLATPANVFSSFFTARGQVPPYNAQLANILNIPGQGQPFFGSLPSLGETPAPPTVPTPSPPQAVPVAATGGTFIPAEPAVAIGLMSGKPLFTFNENAPAQTEKVKITPQKVPGFQEGGTVQSYNTPDWYTATHQVPQAPWNEWPGVYPNPNVPYNPNQYSNGAVLPNYAPAYWPQPASLLPNSPSWQWPATPSFQYGGTALPAPLQDVYDRGFPQFPFLNDLGLGNTPGYPQLGKSLSGFPVPSLQSLNRLMPSEQQSLFDMFNTVFGIPAGDVSAAARYGFNGLRQATPAMTRIQ